MKGSSLPSIATKRRVVLEEAGEKRAKRLPVRHHLAVGDSGQDLVFVPPEIDSPAINLCAVYTLGGTTGIRPPRMLEVREHWWLSYIDQIM
jgi:hypothetical protein